MRYRPQILFRFRDEAQYQEVRDVVKEGLAKSVTEFISLAVDKKLDEILGPASKEQQG